MYIGVYSADISSPSHPLTNPKMMIMMNMRDTEKADPTGRACNIGREQHNLKIVDDDE